MRHLWTPSETEELRQDIETQGSEIAVANFSATHGIDKHSVYNKAWQIKNGKNISSKPKLAATVKSKQDKVIIMLQKEMMKELDIDMTQGKITIKYPKDYMLDLKFM